MTPEEPTLGIVIPTLNEEEYLPSLLEDLRLLPVPHVVVVSDGGSADRTTSLAEAMGARVVASAPGRGRQLATGARVVDAEWILFLHADSRMGPAAREALTLHLREPAGAPAHFAFGIEESGLRWRIMEFGQRLREALTGLAYGDQGLLVRRETLLQAGGYPTPPIMEDVVLLKKLRRLGRVTRLSAALHTSARRYREEGQLRAWIRNAFLISAFLIGVSPERLTRRYRARGARATRRPHVFVFTKNPEPGKVKTRLARNLGDRRAALVYRALGTHVIEGLKGGTYRMIVAYTPAKAWQPLREWLGPDVELVPQVEGDLGERMAVAVRHGVVAGGSVCLVGSDAPDVDRAVVDEAFGALDDVDLVLGPARDGGYYLIAMNEAYTQLFTGIEWSTQSVLEDTLRIAREMGLSVHLLAELTDVDTVDSLPDAFMPPEEIA